MLFVSPSSSDLLVKNESQKMKLKKKWILITDGYLIFFGFEPI